jgi:hypothetical protein
MYQGDHDIESDLNSILDNHVPSTIPKGWTFKRLIWIQNLNKSMLDHEILRAGRRSDHKYKHGGRLKDKIFIFFMETTVET